MVKSLARRSPGFTIVELLVVMAIIAVLIGLLMPAVHKVREASSRVKCSNHLKQLGLALHSYYDVTGGLPPGRVSTPRQHNWVPFILPHLEQQNLHRLYRWDVSWYDAANQAAVTTQLAILQCPSSPQGNRLDDLGGGRAAAAGDYATTITVAPTPISAGFIPATPDTAATLVANRPTRFDEITDGTSTTLMLTEDAGRPEHWVRSGRGPDLSVPGGGNASVTNGRVTGAGWADDASDIPLHGFTPDGLHAPGPC